MVKVQPWVAWPSNAGGAEVNTLPETNFSILFAPENGWLEDVRVSLKRPGLFSGAKMLVPGSGIVVEYTTTLY